MPTVINGTTGITFTDNTIQNTAAIGFRNRIINGGMVIDQRNAGASVSFAASTSGYTVDRMQFSNVTDGAWTAQRSTTTAAGFTNSLLLTVTTADTSLGATQFASVQQLVEGFNVADLGWGTANAQTVTLSFWVRSSLTGTFGGALVNSAQNRSYPFTYTINSAGTFEYKTITIAGDTTGTWLTDNGIGIRVYFGLGVGSTYSGTAGAWAGALYISSTGATSVVGTNGATFYITGVQLERGSTASSFDFRSYGTELALCQRYYYRTSPGTQIANGLVNTTTGALGLLQFIVPLRAAPSALEQSGTAGNYRVRTSGGVTTTCSSVPTFSTASIDTAFFIFTVSSGLTAGQACMVEAVNTSGWLAWSAEL